MASVEQELWNIFTFYTLHGNPLDPEHLRATQFVKLARNVQIVGTTSVSEADINVAYTAEVKRKNRSGIQRMTYNDFLTALMKLSVRVFPKEKGVDEAFQRLLLEHVLALASRRCPDNVDLFLEDEDVTAIRDYYKDALMQIFQFYATNSSIKKKRIEGGHNKALAPMKAKRINTMKLALGYPEFLKFASDFNLSSSVILSTLELGDIYLSAVKASDGEDTVRKLTFSEFWEALVRCALVAYSKISDATIIDKIRGLFLYMWRSMNKNVAKVMVGRRNMSTYAGDLMSGAMLFNKRFTAQWSADGYRDYLAPDEDEAETGAAVFNRLMFKPDAVASATASESGSVGVGSGAGFDAGAAEADEALSASGRSRSSRGSRRSRHSDHSSRHRRHHD